MNIVSSFNDELGRFPSCGSNGEMIKTEGELRAGGGGRKRSCGGGGEGLREEGAAIHAAHASGADSAVDNESSPTLSG
jgi:hypothetical protein